MKKHIIIPTLVLILCLHQSCKHEKATVIPVKQYDINRIVGNYKWNREIRSWIGSWDTTYSISDTTFPIQYVNDTTLTVLKYKLVLHSIDSSLHFESITPPPGRYGVSLNYHLTKKHTTLSYYVGGMGGGTSYGYKGYNIQ